MTRYLRRRLGIAAIVLVAISAISFAAVYLLPGDPVAARYPNIGEEERERLRESMGLTESLPVQYVNYIGGLVEGDWGLSFSTGNEVQDDLKSRFAATAELTVMGLLLALLAGIPLGMVSAARMNRLPDHVSRFVAVATLSAPVFWVGLVFIYVFYYKLGWAPAPVGRTGLESDMAPKVTGLLVLDSIIALDLGSLAEALKYLALPSICLALTVIAPIARITRSAVSDALDQEYVEFATALGIERREILWKDAFINARVSIVTMLGFIVTFLVAGNALVEQVFSWPGIGLYGIQAVGSSDYAALQGYLLTIAVVVVAVNIVVDVAYAYLDPRIRYS